MRRQRVLWKIFPKYHSSSEIANYIMDLDAPKLRLNVQAWYEHARLAYNAILVIATIMSCVLMLLNSLPEYYYEETPDRGMSQSWVPIVELLCVLYFTFDYIVRFMVTHKETWEFIFDGFNIIDLLTIVPYYIELIVQGAVGSASGLGVLFFVRALRLAKLGRYSPMLMSVLESISATSDILVLFVLLYLIVVLWAGTVYFYTENAFFLENATQFFPGSNANLSADYWVRDCPEIRKQETSHTRWGSAIPCQPIARTDESSGVSFTHLYEISPVQSVPDAIYWAFIVTSTLGTRINAPVTPGSRIVTALTVLIGVVLFAIPVTVLTSAFRNIRRRAEASKLFRKLDLRTTVAMKAQEKLKREISYAQRNRENHNNNTDGQIRFHKKRTLEKVTNFTYQGVERPIYRAVDQKEYYYTPLVLLDRDPETGLPHWADDYHPTTSQRIVSCLVTLDCSEAQQAARQALMDINEIPEDSQETDLIVAADPRAVLTVSHDYSSAFEQLGTVVELDQLRNINSDFTDFVPLRFVIPMSHVHPAGVVIQMLKETRIKVTVMTPMQIDEVDMPLSTDIVMASRFVRELSQIAYKRPSDGALLAYIHHSDGAELMKGFTEQFVPTANRDDIILDQYFVDTQLFHSLVSSLPRIAMSQIPPEAAAAFYRGKHLSVDLSDEPLIYVNISDLSQWDLLGFGRRFTVTVPIAKVERTDIQFQLC